MKRRRRVKGLADKERFWWQHFEGWRASGLGQREYCRKHDLVLATFTLWRRRLKVAPDGAVEFVAVPQTSLSELPGSVPARPIESTEVTCSSSHSVVLVIKGGQFRIEIGRDASVETVRLALDAIDGR